MPSKSKAQHNLMEAVAHDPKFAKKVGIPQFVGQDFASADARAASDANTHARSYDKEQGVSRRFTKPYDPQK